MIVFYVILADLPYGCHFYYFERVDIFGWRKEGCCTHITENNILRTVLIIASTTEFNLKRLRFFAGTVRSPNCVRSVRVVQRTRAVF